MILGLLMWKSTECGTTECKISSIHLIRSHYSHSVVPALNCTIFIQQKRQIWCKLYNHFAAVFVWCQHPFKDFIKRTTHAKHKVEACVCSKSFHLHVFIQFVLSILIQINANWKTKNKCCLAYALVWVCPWISMKTSYILMVSSNVVIP